MTSAIEHFIWNMLWQKRPKSPNKKQIALNHLTMGSDQGVYSNEFHSS